MSGIAFAGFFLGYLADKIGRKKSIIVGLVLFALNSYLFSVGRSFVFFVILLVISGVAIGIFKTGALALIGDISQSTVEHTATMTPLNGSSPSVPSLGLRLWRISWRAVPPGSGCT